MDKYTTLNLSDYLGRVLGDVNSNTYIAALRLDFMNEAVEDLQHILIGMHKRGMVGVEPWPWKLLQYENFSYENTITLPNDYYLWIEVRKAGTDDLYEIVPVENIEDETDKAYACVYASNITSPLANSNNTGTDEFQIQGSFSGSSDTNYVVELDAATTFRWSDDGGSTWDVSTVAITGDWQTLNNGVEVKFKSISGYTSGDKWSFSGYVSKVSSILKLNSNPAADVRLTFSRKQTTLAAIDGTTYLPYPRFYSVEKYLTEIRCRSFNEERIDLNVAIGQIAVEKAKEIGREMNAGENLRYTPRGIDHRHFL